MADTPNQPPDDAVSDDVDTGEPIAALADLREPTSGGFLSGIRRRLQRRTLVEDVGEFSWLGFTFIAMSLVGLVFQLLQPGRRDEGDE